jgi:signal transduction histidine kinase
MKRPSDPKGDRDDQLARIIGFGDSSTRKSYYPELRRRLVELERVNQALAREVKLREHSEETLRESQAVLEATLEAAQDGVLVVASDGSVSHCSSRFREMLSIPDDLDATSDHRVLVNYVLPQLVDPEGFVRRLAEIYATSACSDDTLTFRDGRVLGRWSAPLLREGKPEGRVWFFRDITDRIHAEEEIRKLNAELERRVEQRTAQLAAVNASLKEFAYVVSHHLKAPLRAISQLSHWIAEDYKALLDEEGKRKLDLMGGRVTKMHDLIEGILQYSRVGRIDEDRVAVDLDSLVRGVTERLCRGTRVQATVEGAFPVIAANQTRMEQVFENLIGNAVKFMDKPEGRITVGCDDMGDCWRFRVADNGPGIEAKYHERVFGVFQILGRRGQAEGIGIGLALVKKIVEGYGGRVDLQSEAGKGSTFSFTLPKQLHA